MAVLHNDRDMDNAGQPVISREQLYPAAFGERAARYYVPKFLAFEDGTKRFSFVWALLFGAFWFCYRRLTAPRQLFLAQRGQFPGSQAAETQPTRVIP